MAPPDDRNAALFVERLPLGALGARHRRLSTASPADFRAVSRSAGCVRRRLLLPRLRSPEAVDCTAERSLAPRAPVFQAAFARERLLMAAVDEDGDVAIVDAGASRVVKKWTAHRNAVFDVVWTRDDRRLVTASGDLRLRGWDVETQRCVFALGGHSMSVKCVREAPVSSGLGAASVFASGARDGHVMVWDARASGATRPVGVLPSVHAASVVSSSALLSTSSRFLSPPASAKKRRRTPAATTSRPAPPRSVTCVEFTPDGREIVTAGAVDSVVKFWDVRRLAPANALEAGAAAPNTPVLPTRQIDCGPSSGMQRGVSTLAFGDVGATLLVSVLHSAIKLVDVRYTAHHSSFASCHRGPVLLECIGHDASTFYARSAFSPDNDFIVSGSGDGAVYIWDTNGSSSVHSDEHLPPRRLPLFALKGHSSDVNGVAWSPRDFSSIASTSDDGTVRHWQVEREDPDTFRSTQKPPFALCESASSTGWQNWKEFMAEPDGFAYPIVPAPALPATDSVEVKPNRDAAQPESELPTRSLPAESSPFVIRRSDQLTQQRQGGRQRRRPENATSQDRQASVRRRITGTLDRSNNSSRPNSATSSRQQTTLFDCWQRRNG